MMHEGKELVVLWLLPTVWPSSWRDHPWVPLPSPHPFLPFDQEVHIFWTGKQLHLGNSHRLQISSPETRHDFPQITWKVGAKKKKRPRERGRLWHPGLGYFYYQEDGCLFCQAEVLPGPCTNTWGPLLQESGSRGWCSPRPSSESTALALSLTLKPPGGKSIPRWGTGCTVETSEGINGKGRTRTRGLGLGLCPIKQPDTMSYKLGNLDKWLPFWGLLKCTHSILLCKVVLRIRDGM